MTNWLVSFKGKKMIIWFQLLELEMFLTYLLLYDNKQNTLELQTEQDVRSEGTSSWEMPMNILHNVPTFYRPNNQTINWENNHQSNRQ